MNTSLDWPDDPDDPPKYEPIPKGRQVCLYDGGKCVAKWKVDYGAQMKIKEGIISFTSRGNVITVHGTWTWEDASK